MSNRFTVILAGGRGERFWPHSRLHRPKHLLPIVGDTPLLKQTIDRLGDTVPHENIYVLTNREQRKSVLEICPQLSSQQVIGEPVGRDTTAATGLATLLVKNRDPDAIFAMLASDHIIHDTARFQADLNVAFETAESEKALVTIGIKPTNPATGYGYIQKGKVEKEISGKNIYQVTRFVEKPNLKTAETYLKSGEYYWNASMFVWQVPVITNALAVHRPQLWDVFKEIDQRLAKGDELDLLLDEYYPKIEKISIDYAVMEKAERVLTIESAFDWYDVGEWPAIERHYEADEHGNIAHGTMIAQDASGNIVFNTDDRLTALIGVKDIIIAQTPDATLVCHKSQAQDIKKLVQKISENPDWKHLI